MVCVVTQLCSPSNVCGWVWMHIVCIHKAHFPSSSRLAQLFCLHCTLAWLYSCGTYISSPDPILALSSMNLLTCLPTSDQGMDKRTSWHNVQIMPRLHRIQSIVDTHRVCQYLDPTISKLLTILKWRMIPTLNRKQLEKQRVEPHCSLAMRYTYFPLSMLLSVLEIV